MTVKTFSVPGKGIGKDDYSREISAGRERAGIALKYNQKLKIFGTAFHIGEELYPDIPANPLAAGVRCRLIDLETNLATPYTVPAGYILSLFAAGVSVDQDMLLMPTLIPFTTTALGPPVVGY